MVRASPRCRESDVAATLDSAQVVSINFLDVAAVVSGFILGILDVVQAKSRSLSALGCKSI
jgi:hypothetical protein